MPSARPELQDKFFGRDKEGRPINDGIELATTIICEGDGSIHNGTITYTGNDPEVKYAIEFLCCEWDFQYSPYFDVTGDDDKRPKPNYCFAVVTGGTKEQCVFPACHCGLSSAAAIKEEKKTLEAEIERLRERVKELETKLQDIRTLKGVSTACEKW